MLMQYMAMYHVSCIWQQDTLSLLCILDFNHKPTITAIRYHLGFHIFFHNSLLWGCALFYWFELCFTSFGKCIGKLSSLNVRQQYGILITLCTCTAIMTIIYAYKCIFLMLMYASIATSLNYPVGDFYQAKLYWMMIVHLAEFSPE